MRLAEASAALCETLVHRGLAGAVRTTRRQSLDYVESTLSGSPDHVFGLTDWRDATRGEVLTAVKGAIGDSLDDGDPDEGYIAPERTVDGILNHARSLRPLVRDGGASVLLATGHPTGLLEHYAEVARVLTAAGNRVLRPLDDHRLDASVLTDAPPNSGIRFIGGVGCAFDDEAILHTHLAVYMRAMIDALEARGQVLDLVIADHGMAGAAIEAGIPTLSIADANDVALPLAWWRGRHDGLLCIEDNLTPAVFTPVTEFMLAAVSDPSIS